MSPFSSTVTGRRSPSTGSAAIARRRSGSAGSPSRNTAERPKGSMRRWAEGTATATPSASALSARRSAIASISPSAAISTDAVPRRPVAERSPWRTRASVRVPFSLVLSSPRESWKRPDPSARHVSPSTAPDPSAARPSTPSLSPRVPLAVMLPWATPSTSICASVKWTLGGGLPPSPSPPDARARSGSIGPRVTVPSSSTVRVRCSRSRETERTRPLRRSRQS